MVYSGCRKKTRGYKWNDSWGKTGIKKLKSEEGEWGKEMDERENDFVIVEQLVGEIDSRAVG